MDNSVSPMPELAPIAEFDKTPPTPPHEEMPLDDLPPPPSAPALPDEPLKKRRCGSCDESSEPWGCASWMEYTLMVSLSVLLLVGSLALAVFWTLYYRGGFAWRENPELQFNIHPVAMITGFVFFGGLAMMLYRICRCCKRLYVKMLHAIFHALTVPCVVLGLMAVWDYHNLSQTPIPNFYSLHSWMGIATVGLFVLQFVMGLFSFLVLLTCGDSTSNFRQRLIPIHAAFGLSTFILAIATCLTGLSQKANLTLGKYYPQSVEEGLLMNSLGMLLVFSGIFVAYVVSRAEFRTCPNSEHPDVMAQLREKYVNWEEEGIVINALGVTLVAIVVLVIVSLRRYNRQRCPRVTSDPNTS